MDHSRQEREEEAECGARDRVGNLFFIAAASGRLAGRGSGSVQPPHTPNDNPTNALVGAGFIGLAGGFTLVPVFWLVSFAHHRRIALLGDWGRALRRGASVAAVMALLVALRIQEILSLPIAVFVIVLVLLAEIALSMER